MKARTITGVVAGLALILGGPATVAFADDAPVDTTTPAVVTTDTPVTPDPTPTDTTPPVDTTIPTPDVTTFTAPVAADVYTPPATTCDSVLWQTDTYGSKYGQTVSNIIAGSCELQSLPTTCGTGWQSDVYIHSDAEQALLDGKKLAGPDGAQDGSFLEPGGQGVAYNYAQNDACPPPPPTPQTCTPGTSISTASFNNGWATEDTAPNYTVGGLEFYTPNASSKVNYYNRNVAGTPLAGVDGLGYVVSGAGGAQTSYQLEIFTNGTSGYDSLVWEPYQNGFSIAGDGSSRTYTDLEGGQWWSTHSIPGDVGSSGSNQLLTTLTAIEIANPNAVIIGQALSQGSNNAGGDYWVTASTFDCTTTTFPAVPSQPDALVTTNTTSAFTCTPSSNPAAGTEVDTTVVTTTPYVLDAESNSWVIDTENATSVTTVSDPRPATADELAANPTCVAVVVNPPTTPTLPKVLGFTGTSAATVAGWVIEGWIALVLALGAAVCLTLYLTVIRRRRAASN